jgi:hypothetical protein
MEADAMSPTSRNVVDADGLPVLHPRRTEPPNRWVVLDESWAKRLGVQRTSGIYRIRSRELVRRLAASAHPTEADDAPGAPVEAIAGHRTVETSMIAVPRRKAG